MEERNSVVYSLCVEDIQNVALEGFGRALTEGEIEIVREHLGDYIQRHDIIKTVINVHVILPPFAR
jgi:hypothetical protein